jgi:hypothetical protein
VPAHGVADGLADHETGPRPGPGVRGTPGPGGGPFGEVVQHQGGTSGTSAGPHHRGELRPPAQACLRRQHLRRRACRDPCHGGRRGWRARPGCASAAGSRGPSTGDGCSAGTCACSRGTPTADDVGAALTRSGPARMGTGRSSARRPPDRHPYPRLVCCARVPGETSTRRDDHQVLCTDSDQHSRDAARTAAGHGAGRTVHGAPVPGRPVLDTPRCRVCAVRRRCRAVDEAVSVAVAPRWTTGCR